MDISNRIKVMDIPTPTDLRISTSTATCNINSFINLELIYDFLSIDDNIKYIEYGSKPPKGEYIGKQKSLKAKKKKKLFFNQITIIVKPLDDTNYIFNNVKLFNNGAVSMTGLKKNEGEKSIKHILDRIKNIRGVIYHDIIDTKNIIKKSINNVCKFCNIEQSSHNLKLTNCGHNICNICVKQTNDICKECGVNLIETAIVNPNICKIKDYKIVLINSDYYIGFDINRESLYDILNNKYHIFSSYEPCIYPGVNSKYYWNLEYINKPFQGKCYCDIYCSGKGNGIGNGKCKKITISTFQSGSIIITGARNMEQINTAYTFINKIMRDNYKIVRKPTNILCDVSENNAKKNLKIKKCYIINYPSIEQINKINELFVNNR